MPHSRLLHELAPRQERWLGGGVGDGVDEAIEEGVEFGGGIEVHGLGEVVLGAVVADLIPLAIALLGIGAGVVTEDKADGGDADAQEGILVGAAEQVALGLAVVADFNLHFCADVTSGLAERGVVDGLRSEDVERKERTQLIEIDVGDELFFGDGEVSSEPVRPERRPFSSPVKAQKRILRLGCGSLPDLMSSAI